jgi:hypothetical protein
LINQDELLIPKSATNTIVNEQQQQIEEPKLSVTTEPSTSKEFEFQIFFYINIFL